MGKRYGIRWKGRGWAYAVEMSDRPHPPVWFWDDRERALSVTAEEAFALCVAIEAGPASYPNLQVFEL